MAVFEKRKVAAAVRTEEDFQASLKSQVEVVFLLYSNILTIKQHIDEAHNAGKLIFIHMDFIEGIGKDRIGLKYLKENMNLSVLTHEGSVIGVDLPAHVELEVVNTPPAEKGNTSQGGTKPAETETGAIVNVPFFVVNGDRIRIDTRTNEYLDRC